MAQLLHRTKVKGTWVRPKTNPEQEPDFWSMPWVGVSPTNDASRYSPIRPYPTQSCTTQVIQGTVIRNLFHDDEDENEITLYDTFNDLNAVAIDKAHQQGLIDDVADEEGSTTNLLQMKSTTNYMEASPLDVVRCDVFPHKVSEDDFGRISPIPYQESCCSSITSNDRNNKWFESDSDGDFDALVHNLFDIDSGHLDFSSCYVPKSSR